MNCCLKNPNEDTQYIRTDWLVLSEKELLEQMDHASEIYLGDFCFWHDDPGSFLVQLFQETDDDSVLYIDGPEIYETISAIACQELPLEVFSENVFSANYKRFVDLHDCRKYIEDAGFSILHEDIDNRRLCISFQKPFKKST